MKIIIVLLIFIVGCTPPPTKPFIIHASGQCSYGERTYYYYTPNDYGYSFVDSCGKYSVGDTIN